MGFEREGRPRPFSGTKHAEDNREVTFSRVGIQTKVTMIVKGKWSARPLENLIEKQSPDVLN